MIKRYCFTSEAQALELLHQCGYMVQRYEWDEELELDVAVGDPEFPHNMKGNGWDIIVLGTISKPTGEVNEEGNPLMEALDGWHVDILTKHVPEPMEPFLVEPKAPVHCV